MCPLIILRSSAVARYDEREARRSTLEIHESVLDSTDLIWCNERMITRSPVGVTTPVELPRAEERHEPGISALDAATLARITYRQLDHWARQGWVRPSLDPGTGRSGRRRYASEDVVRL